MADVLTMRFKSDDIDKVVAKLRDRAPRGIVRALSRAATSARAVMARNVAKDLGGALKIGDVKELIRQEEPKLETLTARLIISGKRLELIKFGARQTKRGVTANTGGGRKVYPGLFIATMGSGHTGVYARRGRKRLPIDERFGPSLPHVFTKYLPDGEARGREQLIKNLQSELRFALISET